MIEWPGRNESSLHVQIISTDLPCSVDIVAGSSL